MKVEISREMAMVVVTALAEHYSHHKWQLYRPEKISNLDALEFFRGVVVDIIEEEEGTATRDKFK